MRARVNDAAAHPALERDAPLPAAGWGGRGGEGMGGARHPAGRGDGGVARKPGVPSLIAGAELVLDKQPSEAGAIDEQLALDFAAVGEGHRPDMAVPAVERDVD